MKDAERAAVNYEAACALLQPRLKADPTLEAKFWRWMLRLMQARMYLGAAGSTDSYGEIINTVEPQLASEMGGLKAEFENILRRAKEKKAKR